MQLCSGQANHVTGRVDVERNGDAVRAAVAVERVDAQDGSIQPPGVVAFYDAETLELLKVVTVGALPGMLTFAKKGRLVVVANEGDARDYDGFSEEARIKDLVLDPSAFPNAAELQADENLGRLLTTDQLGDTDGDGDFDKLFSYGARSFAFWNEHGKPVFDSGSQLEKITAAVCPDNFNATNDENNFDNRSDDKGPEPEGLDIARLWGRVYAFLGLERIGGIVVYDISKPYRPRFVTYVNNRNFDADVCTEVNVDGECDSGETNPEVGDLGPEGRVLSVETDGASWDTS